MAIQNGSFEIAGAAPGDADQWTTPQVSTAREYAGFDALGRDRVQVMAVVSVGFLRNWKLLSAAAGETPSDVAACVSSSALGAICSLVPINAWSSARKVGIAYDEPASLCVILDATTSQPMYSGGRRIMGLLQVETGTVDGQAFDDATHQAQISFVRDDLAGGLEAVPMVDIQSRDIFYAYTRRVTGVASSCEDLEHGWPGVDSFLFTLGAAESAVFNSLAIPTIVEAFELGWGAFGFIDELGSSSPAQFDAYAFLDSDPETYDLSLGAQLSIETDAGGPALTDAIAGTKAILDADATGFGPPYGFSPLGEQFKIHLNGRHIVTVTVDNTIIDVADLADECEAQALAQGVPPGEFIAYYFGGPARLFLQSEWQGFASSVMVESVTPGTLQRIGFSLSQFSAPVYGTGNVSLRGAVPAADVANLINGTVAVQSIGAGATDVAGVVRVYSPPEGTIRINTTAMGTALGFILDTTEGPSALPTDTDEDFGDWGSYQDAFVGIGTDLTAALFDGEAVEDFEEQWLGNGSFIFTFLPGHIDAALFDGETAEDFEEVFFAKTFTANPATDTMTSVLHGFLAGARITLLNTGGQLPAGLNLNSEYYVITVAPNTFQLARTSGGAAIDITDSGTGTHKARHDPSVYWTLAMATI
jgi:hypothetical protein